MADHTASRRAAAQALTSSTALTAALGWRTDGASRSGGGAQTSAAPGARAHPALEQIKAAQARMSAGDVAGALPYWSAAVLLAPQDAALRSPFLASFEHVLGAARLAGAAIDLDDALLTATLRCVAAEPGALSPSLLGPLCEILAHLHHPMVASADGAAPSPAATALLAALLTHDRVVDPTLERLLIALRGRLLQQVRAAAETGGRPSAPWPALAEALALQAQEMGYLWVETSAEAAALVAIEARVVAQLESGAPLPAHELFTLGAYRPLHKIAVVRCWVRALAGQAPLDPALNRLVLEPMKDAALADRVVALTELTGGAAQTERADPEAVVRWRHLARAARVDFVQALAKETGLRARDLPATNAAPRVLVAGCGAGREALAFAQRVPAAQLLAIDLDRACLGYATRKALELELGNIVFAQADILALDGEASFDVVQCCDVLHELAEPARGLSVLAARLKPGGYLKLGLPRAPAADVAAARAAAETLDLAPGLEGARALRRHCLEPARAETRALLKRRAFYAAPELRELVSPRSARSFDVAETAALLREAGLDPLGLADAPDALLRRYRERFGPTAPIGDLGNWAMLEAEAPRAFPPSVTVWARTPD